jgi:hypothetical protein
MTEQLLGFGESIQAQRIFIGKESGCFWYFWNSENQKPIPITESALTGYLRKVEKIELTSDYGVSEKLIITIDSGITYQIQVGFSTWFAKILLISINALDDFQLRRILTFEPYSKSNSKVVFCNLFDWRKSKINSKHKWERDKKGNLIDNVDYDALYNSIAARLPSHDDLEKQVSEIEPEQNLETFTDLETGEVIF